MCLQKLFHIFPVRVARYFLTQYTKTCENIPITTNGHKIYQNDRKIFQMTLKYTSIFHSKASKIYPNSDFWFVNKPSGSPVPHSFLSTFSVQIWWQPASQCDMWRTKFGEKSVWHVTKQSAILKPRRATRFDCEKSHPKCSPINFLWLLLHNVYRFKKEHNT
jgi:hypothetical protein